MNSRLFAAKIMLVALLGMAVFAGGLLAREIPRPVKSGRNLNAENKDRALRAFPAAPYDTFVVAEYDFEKDDLSGPDAQGWIPVDLTEQLGTFFHVDSFHVPSGGGTQAIWCGARPAGEEPLCTYRTLPGYGNDWDQMFTSVSFPRSGDVTLSYSINYDTEPGYDYVHVQCKNSAGNWIDLKQYTDQASGVLDTLVIPAGVFPNSVQVRFYFTSDAGWSDEDGKWDTAAGACQIDNIVLRDTTGVIDSQDFEGEALDALATFDGNWSAEVIEPFGHYARLYTGTMLKQDDPCYTNISSMWAFVNGSTTFGCAEQGLDGDFVIPFQREDGQAFHAGIQSPVIDLTTDIYGNPVPSDVDTTLLICDVYTDLPLDNLVFFYFASQNYPTAAGCPEPWVYSEFFWYEDTPTWKHFSEPDFFLPLNGEAGRVRLLGIDNCPIWCGQFGTGACHTKAPYIDNVKLVRIRANGPTWDVRPDYALFSDGFPSDGSTTGTVRMDRAADASFSAGSPAAGDSVVVTVWDDRYGLGLDATGTDPSRAAVYLYVRSSGGQVGPEVAGEEGTYVSDDGMWTRILCDSAASLYTPPEDQFACDLNDNLFLPGDLVEMYYSATNGIGRTNYYSSKTGVVTDEGLVRANPDEAQCLPSGATDILLVDTYGTEQTHAYFDQIFNQMGEGFDRFDGRSANSPLSSYALLSLHTTGAQLAEMYNTIIWHAGPAGVLSEDEALLLVSFLEEQGAGARNANLYLTGSSSAHRLSSFLKTKLGMDLNSYSLRDHTKYFPMNPTVTAAVGSFFGHGGVPDEFYLHACAEGFLPHRFDVLKTANTGFGEMAYGPPTTAIYFATVSNTFVDGAVTVRTVTDGFDVTAVRDDEPGYPHDMVDHVSDILNWFGHANIPTDVASPVQYKNELGQNYPNPFNPVTAIRFQVTAKSFVSLKIYDVSGRLIDTLINEELSPKPGGHEVRWDGTDRFGNRVASGVYLYRLSTKDFEQTRKLVLLK